MAELPSNREAPTFGSPAKDPLPTRVQADSFGSRQPGPAGGELVTGRAPAPRPALASGSAQGRERIVTTGQIDGPSLSKALNAIQSKVADSTAQARAFPMANGRLFQGVAITGTPAAGPTSSRPSGIGLPEGFLYFDTTVNKPYWLSAGDWVDAGGIVTYAGSGEDLSTTKIDHGFGTPAVGVIVTNVKEAIISTSPRLVSGDSDNTTARVWFAYLPLTPDAVPSADIYVYY